MKGLRTQESKKFEKFFDIVQKKASEKNSVFFLDSGEGNEISYEGMECEELSGWLIPKEKSEAFERIWGKREEDDEWVEFFCFVKCTKINGTMNIVFDF